MEKELTVRKIMSLPISEEEKIKYLEELTNKNNKLIDNIKKKKIYNPESNENINQRRLFGGNPDGMINFTKMRYAWALNIWQLMEKNIWFPGENDMTKDKSDYPLLTEPEKRMYDLVLSQLIFMDSLQTNNIMDNINPYITVPEINACLAFQSFQEALHSKAYAVMVESISDNTSLIYDMWKTDEKLRTKNTEIAKVYEELSEGEVTDVKIILALVANQILEGIYFYAGFAAMFALAKTGKMMGSANMIRFILKDEISHLLLFQNMINSAKKERPELFTKELENKIRHMFKKAVDLESDWGHYITQGQILGFTNELITQYIQYLADRRLHAIGYDMEYNVNHPMPWIDMFSSFNEQKSNFFESSGTANYTKGALEFEDF